MDRFIQWAWDHHGPRYSWVVSATPFVVVLPIYLFLSSAIVAVEHSSRYWEAAGAAAVAVLVIAYVLPLPGHGVWRLAEQWAAGRELDRARALEATYDWSRGAIARQLVGITGCGAVVSVSASAIAGATGLRLVQYAVVGGVVGAGSHLSGVHTVAEGPMRPVRIALVGDMGIGDSLPRSPADVRRVVELGHARGCVCVCRCGRDVGGGVSFCEPAAHGVGDDRMRVDCGLRCSDNGRHRILTVAATAPGSRRRHRTRCGR